MSWNLILILIALSSSLAAEPFQSRFECKQVGDSLYRPYYLKSVNGGTHYLDYSETAKGLLGQNPMRSKEECDQALKAANHEYGVICSRTGIDGWKPTLYTGTIPGRADFGYLGGSSMNRFEDCLKATENSSKKGVCYWGGSGWYISPIDREGFAGGAFRSLDDCISHTRE